MSKTLSKVLLLIGALGMSVLALEWALGVAARRDLIRVDLNPMTGFWSDRNPDFGVWHASNAKFDHVRPCFSVQYESNSYGAIDVERTPRSEHKRIVVLGDSMMEGYTLHREERVSNLLESATGLEFMNFATSQTFSPIQYLLAYETLARRFDHDAVLIGLLPENDFTDSNWKLGRNIFYNRYRPYFVRSGDSYELVYFSKSFLNRDATSADAPNDLFDAFLNRTNTGRTIRTAYAMIRYKRAITSAEQAFSKVRSWYYDYSEGDWRLLEFTLKRLVKSAGGRPVVVATIPMERDLIARRTLGPPPLPARFEKFAQAAGIVYIDLLEPFAAAYDQGKLLYHSCDHHWTAEANRLAAGLLQPKMAAALARTK